MTDRIPDVSNDWFKFGQRWRMLSILAFLLVVYNFAIGIGESRASEPPSVDGSKLISLREGIDDIGQMTLQTFVDRLAEFNVGGARMKITIHPHSQSSRAKGFEVRALDQSRASPSPIRFNFLPSRVDDTYVVLTTVSYKKRKFTKFRQKIQMLTQLAVIRMNVEGIRRQEEESRRHIEQVRRCMETQRNWITQAENTLRKELRLPDNATFAQRQRAMEEERVRMQELRRRSRTLFDQCVGE